MGLGVYLLLNNSLASCPLKLSVRQLLLSTVRIRKTSVHVGVKFKSNQRVREEILCSYLGSKQLSFKVIVGVHRILKRHFQGVALLTEVHIVGSKGLQLLIATLQCSLAFDDLTLLSLYASL